MNKIFLSLQQAELKAVQEEAEAERQKLLKDALTAKLNKLKQHQDSSSLSAGEKHETNHWSGVVFSY